MSVWKSTGRKGVSDAICADNSVVMRRVAPSPGPSEGEHGPITEMFESMRGELLDLLPDSGKRLGYGGKAIQSNSTGRKRLAGKIACGPGKQSGTIFSNVLLGTDIDTREGCLNKSIA